MALKPFMTTTWSHLAMLNYEVHPALLRSFVPRGTELDDFNNRYFVSIVGFLFRDTRFSGIAVPGYRRFPEVNLRMYVRCRAGQGWRRGVVFIKEIVPLRVVTWTARRFYEENFFTHPMRWKIEVDTDDPRLPMRVEYTWKTAQDWHQLEVHTEGSPALPVNGSEADFITEHYWGYTARRDGTTSEYRVEHPQWRVSPAVNATFRCDVAAVYGSRFVEALTAQPSSVFLAEGSRVNVYKGQRLDLSDTSTNAKIRGILHC